MQARLRSAKGRRGVTLVEMLVTVAMLVLIMTIMVQVFQAATGALSTAQKLQQIDDQLRRVDSLIHSDLEGVTARFTPPLDPAQNLGYFEYGENEFPDLQGEDSDDYVRFTAKAPDGRPFTGRMWVGNPHTTVNPTFLNQNVQPVTITSEYAEIIYFLRNGNLYRRVLLIAPQLQQTIVQSNNNLIYNSVTNTNAGSFQPVNGFNAVVNGTAVSWQGVNDLSAHPAPSGNSAINGGQSVVLNTLGMLTNRENRAFSPRFANDFWNSTTALTNANGGEPGQDGIPDDLNSDNVPDSYPSLYFGVFKPTNPNVTGWTLTYEPPYTVAQPQGRSFTTMAFPFVFPGAYSAPQQMSNPNLTAEYGWIHAPLPYANVLQGGGLGNVNCELTSFDSSPLAYLQSINHNPLDFGDNLPTPNNPLPNEGKLAGNLAVQTWWGFPTWRETLSSNWNDPTIQVNLGTTTSFQPNGLAPRTTAPSSPGNVAIVPDAFSLPWMFQPNAGLLPANLDFSLIRPNQQLYSDVQAFGTMSLFLQQGNNTGTVDPLWFSSWEDDLILTGVRSFDIKAYDNSVAGFVDLGWGDDVRLTLAQPPAGVPRLLSGNTGVAPGGTFLSQNQDFSGINGQNPPLVNVNGSGFDYINNTFLHEGRMPPLVEDRRADAQFGLATYPLPANNTYTGNIGDDSQGIVRLRRVWDSWSTEYSQAPANGVTTLTVAGAPPAGGFPVGPPYTPPIYPSYPPPYPAALRGIQIQIRVVDPTNQKVKSLTIRQDFSDKL
jgi:type II secretory pathway component PulJ